MDDPALDRQSAAPQSWSTLYHDAAQAASLLVAHDLESQDASVQPDPSSSEAVAEERQASCYCTEHDDHGPEDCVPVDRRQWTPEDRLRVLRYLAEMLRNGRLRVIVKGGEHSLEELWVRGGLPSVDRLCSGSRAELSAARADELKWLLSMWKKRQAAQGVAVPPADRRAAARRSISPRRAQSQSQSRSPSSLRRSRVVARRRPGIPPAR